MSQLCRELAACTSTIHAISSAFGNYATTISYYLLVADEIATGFGRTGKLFACEQSAISPDIMCIGKGLTGGTMTLSATLSTAIADDISNGSARCFMHGPTFMDNPLAWVSEDYWQDQVAAIRRQLATALLPLRSAAQVIDVRVLGAIRVVETRSRVNMVAMQQFFVEHGVWTVPLVN